MKFKWKKNAEPVETQEPYYDLVHGGYIDPHAMLPAEQADEVVAAYLLIEEFFEQGEAAGKILIG